MLGFEPRGKPGADNDSTPAMGAPVSGFPGIVLHAENPSCVEQFSVWSVS